MWSKNYDLVLGRLEKESRMLLLLCVEIWCFAPVRRQFVYVCLCFMHMLPRV